MLIKFTVGNFLSFKGKLTINLSASKITEHSNNNVFETNFKDLKLLKSFAVYGYNSSGKSNLLDAFNFVRWFIINSSKDFQADENIGIVPFMLCRENKNMPSHFEVEFLMNNYKYKYGFEVDNNKIHKEWLYFTKIKSEFLLFERIEQNVKIGNKFLADNELFEKTRENALFLSVTAQFNNSIAIDVIKIFRGIKVISGITDKRYLDYTANLLNDKRFAVFIEAILIGGFLGFKNVDSEKIDMSEGIESSKLPEEIKSYLLKTKPKDTLVRTEHEVFDESNKLIETTYFDLDRDESEGTKKFFSLIGPIVETLIEGRILLIDEFDARMHPKLSEALIQLFNSNRNNPRNAQLIFATHDTNYLRSNILRRDQVYIVVKDKFGASTGETLYDKGIRKDASFEKDFLLGESAIIPEFNLPFQALRSGNG